jgi:malate dehydrogenase (quinone)
MLELLEKSFADRMASPEWQGKVKAMIPSYGQSLVDDPALFEQVRAYTTTTLQLGKGSMATAAG